MYSISFNTNKVDWELSIMMMMMMMKMMMMMVMMMNCFYNGGPAKFISAGLYHLGASL